MKIITNLIIASFISTLLFLTNSGAEEKIKIGLIIPLSGENREIGESILNATRLAVNKINDSKILIIPRDTESDPQVTYEVAKELYALGVKIIIGPIFNQNLKYLDELDEIIFLSLSNKILDNPKNVISAGINAVSQINTIKKFQKKEKIERSLLLMPKIDYKNEIEKAVRETKINLKDTFVYDTDPTILTSQISKFTRYPQRKQNLQDEINRIKNSNDINKEKKIKNLEKRDTLGGINFDSVIIADFDESLKSVTTSLLYSDISGTRIKYITLNQWFDKSLLTDKSLQPIYFPSINKKNFDTFSDEYNKIYKKNPNEISFLSYDIIGLVYYLLYKNNFILDDKLFYKKNKFKGKVGIFEINKNKISHILNFYVAENNKFKKIF